MCVLVEASCSPRIRADESEAPHDLDVARFLHGHEAVVEETHDAPCHRRRVALQTNQEMLHRSYSPKLKHIQVNIITRSTSLSLS